MMDDKLTETLKKAGYSVTKPRLAVFTSLQAGRPRSMRELTLDLSSVIDRASLYRTIALFEKLGIVVKVQAGWKYKIELSDQFTPHHHHLTCLSCGKVISFDEPPGFETLLNSIAAKHGFVARDHSLEISGLCPDCRLNASTLKPGAV